MTDYKFTILNNAADEDHLHWVKACENVGSSEGLKIDYKIIDITRSRWLEEIINDDAHCILTRPPANLGYLKQLYDERLYILHKVMGKNIYPTYEEILVYENKRVLAYWLQANQIAHPRTSIFYNKEEALEFIQKSAYPIVAKTAIGASGSGVKILATSEEAAGYIGQAFSSKGISRKWGPNLRRGDIAKRLFKRLINIPGFIRYMNKKREDAVSDPQKYYVLFQEYIQCDYEWRCVRVGDSFFGHKKLARVGEIKSGTSKVSWDPPSEELLDFVKHVTDKRGFQSQSVDLFVGKDGFYLVNELQAFWGSKNPHQMIVDEKPGRYVQKEGRWVFEEGEFNLNNSYDLRLKHVIDLLK